MVTLSCPHVRTFIAGLYACGNDMNSVMAGKYPAPGITLGPAIAFGYAVAVQIAKEDSII